MGGRALGNVQGVKQQSVGTLNLISSRFPVVQKAKKNHKDLNKGFERLGRNLVKMKPNKADAVSLNNPSGHTNGTLSWFIKEAKKTNLQSAIKKFGGKYRRAQSEQDELVSTSSVREIVTGIFNEIASKSPASAPAPADLKILDELIDTISSVRFPTKFSGFSVLSKKMQHPTAKSEAIFADPSSTASLHSELDLERKATVHDAFVLAESERGSSPHSVVYAGLRAAIEFTLNQFTAPITAQDVHPYSLNPQNGNFMQDELEQVAAREKLKAIYVSLKGTQETAVDTTLTRTWNSRGRRSVSPPRGTSGTRGTRGTKGVRPHITTSRRRPRTTT